MKGKFPGPGKVSVAEVEKKLTRQSERRMLPGKLKVLLKRKMELWLLAVKIV